MPLDATQKKILKVAGVGCGVIAVFLVIAGYLLVKRFVAPEFTRHSLDSPEKVGPLGVVLGKGFLQQSAFLTDEKLGVVSHIAIGKVDPNPQVSMVVTSDHRADFLSAQGKLLRSLQFPADTPLSFTSAVDVDRDGACEFIGRDLQRHNLFLFSHAGKPLWNYGGAKLEIMGSSLGDLNGDGKPEFVLSGVDGLDLVNAQGKRVWHQPDRNVRRVAIADLDHDGKPEIVHSNVGGEFVLRDAQGRVQATRKLVGPGIFPVCPNHFTITKWPSSSGALDVLFATDKDFRLADHRGRIVARLPAPKVDRHCGAFARPVRLRAGEPEYLALLATFPQAERSILYVYDSRQKLVYEEILPAKTWTFAVQPLPNTKAQALLVGGDGRVLQYTAARTKQ